MAPFVLKNCRLYVAGYDLSGFLNEMALQSEREAKDSTCFNADTQHSIPGLFKNAFAHKGLYEAGQNPDREDQILSDRLGLLDDVVTICPTNGTAGEPAYFTKQLEVGLTLDGKIGEIFAFSVNAQGTADLLRGTVLENGTRAATGNGAAFNVGQVQAGHKLYGAMHVLAASGTDPTLDVVVASDDAPGFASPTNRLTFNRATAIGAQFLMPVDGPITDTWWRAQFTIGGTTPSFTAIVVVAII